MLSRFLRWIGWETGQDPARSERPSLPRGRSATSHLFEKRPPPADQKSPKASSSKNDFNPYNTGKFDRSASWERISKNQR